MGDIPAKAVWIVLGVTAALALGAAITAWLVPYVQGVLPG